MLARSTQIRHPLGVSLQTPLLVPSFSSKALGFNKAGKSELKKVFEVASVGLTDIMLVSAFDLAYGHLKPIMRAITDVVIIDSGGYEVSDLQDFSAVHWEPARFREAAGWSEEKLCEVYEHWPEHIPAILVSFDRPDLRYSLEDQIERARQLFSAYPGQMYTLLVKPESESEAYIQAKNVIAHVGKLKDFNVIGFTEKELGDSVLNRMENVAAVRLAMDDAALRIPIHVYGSLDPITSVLYFLAGAEMFDGLTWIRYGYADGFACYYHNYSARKIGIAETEEYVKAKTRQDNLGYLLELKYKMQNFLRDSDFRIFGDNAELLRESYALLQAKNRRIR
jgi:hypothetical protein